MSPEARARRAEYARDYRRGIRRPRRLRPPAVRLLERTDRVYGPVLVPELGRCWEWTGARNIRGYGVISIENRLWLTHRLALAIALGRDIRPGFYANHRCDNKPCVRPSHLYEGTHAENTRDYWIRRDPRPLPAAVHA